MLAIKLRLAGRKKQRSFRVIIQEARSKLNGKFVEDIGWYNPHTNQFRLNKERLNHWIEKGAKPTESAARVIAKSKADSGTETYEARDGRKRKKKEKALGAAEANPPKADAQEAPAEAKVESTGEERKVETPETEVEKESADATDEASGEKVEEKEPDK